MPRYIDADKLNIKKATMWFDDPNDRRSVERMIREAPTVDAVPVVHAYWDDSGRYRFERDGSLAIPCSNCGCALKEDEYKKYIWSYCPKCGARMDADTQAREGV